MTEFEFVTWLKAHVYTNTFGGLGKSDSILEILKNLHSVETTRPTTAQYQPSLVENVETEKEIFRLFSLAAPLTKDDPAIFVQLPPGDTIDKLFVRILVKPQDLGCLEMNAFVTSDSSKWFEIPKPQSWVVTIDSTDIPKHKYLGVSFQGPFSFDLGFTRKYLGLN